MMKALTAAAVVASLLLSLSIIGFAADDATKKGETLFKKHCASCHPDGKNIINPQKGLYKKDLDTNNVKTADDIIKLMRNPGPGMVKFDEKIISANDAKLIAEYIIKTFK